MSILKSKIGLFRDDLVKWGSKVFNNLGCKIKAKELASEHAMVSHAYSTQRENLIWHDHISMMNSFAVKDDVGEISTSPFASIQ